MPSSKAKYNLLLQTLRQYQRLAIAFSGGVDSTFLLHSAVEALGPENVIALCACSTLNSRETIQERRLVLEKNFPQAPGIREVDVFPLSWQEFVANDKDRCYHCKKKMYLALQQAMDVAGFTVLADGTNSDDNLEERPGLRAVQELQVITPLADVTITKAEVRQLAEDCGLSNYNLASNSCLATRVPQNTPISEQALRIIESAEQFLHAQGFLGCRVKLNRSSTIIEIEENDFSAFVGQANRKQVNFFFDRLQLPPVMLSLRGR